MSDPRPRTDVERIEDALDGFCEVAMQPGNSTASQLMEAVNELRKRLTPTDTETIRD